MTKEKKSILFICTHNSARSQMAEGLVNALYSNKFSAQSAGTVATQVNPFAIEAMKEIGIDITHYRSKSVEKFKGRIFDIVVTVCDNARETCPFFPGKKVIHKGFDDPASVRGSDRDKLEAFKSVRDEIKNWLDNEFLREGRRQETELRF